MYTQDSHFKQLDWHSLLTLSVSPNDVKIDD